MGQVFLSHIALGSFILHSLFFPPPLYLFDILISFHKYDCAEVEGEVLKGVCQSSSSSDMQFL